MNYFNIIQRSKNRIDQFDINFLKKLYIQKPEKTTEVAHGYPVSVLDTFSTEVQDVDIPFETVVDMQESSVYIQIPWCRLRCIYCRYPDAYCQTVDDDVYRRFLEKIRCQLAYYNDRFKCKKLYVNRLYIGGGTPSLLSVGQLRQLFQALDDTIDFKDQSFRVMEVSPSSLTYEKVKLMFEYGINRVSIGVQSFTPHILKAIGRVAEGPEEVRNAMKLLRSFNIPEINIDIMPGLPKQSLEDFVYDVEMATQLKPSSISFLDLEVWTGSFLEQNHIKNTFFDFQKVLIMRSIYQEILSTNGYVFTRPHYGVLPNEMRNASNRMVCTDNRQYGKQIGLGPHAISHIGDMVYRTTSFKDFMETEAPINMERFLRVSPDVAHSMKIITSLVNEKSLIELAYVSFPKECDFLKKNDLINEQGELTETGCLFGSEIMYLFYPGSFID